MRNAKGSFSFKKTFGRPSNDRNGQNNNTNGAIAEEVQLPWPIQTDVILMCSIRNGAAAAAPMFFLLVESERDEPKGNIPK